MGFITALDLFDKETDKKKKINYRTSIQTKNIFIALYFSHLYKFSI
jgi:hypothetical protein